MLMPETVELALREFAEKPLAQIHLETAMLWLARAVAAHKLYVQTGQQERYLDAMDCAHEALEHGALAGMGMGAGSSVVSYIEMVLIPLHRGGTSRYATE